MESKKQVLLNIFQKFIGYQNQNQIVYRCTPITNYFTTVVFNFYEFFILTWFLHYLILVKLLVN